MSRQTMEVKLITTEKDLNKAFAIRKKVFVAEQQVPAEEEIDDLETEASHFLLIFNNTPAGAGRFRIVEGYGKVERICILKEFRGTGAGKALMKKIQTFAVDKGLDKIKLNAQIQAIPFYSKLGYETVSEEFLDAGIPHKTMIKHI